MSNRTYFIICSFLQNSKLSRVNFVNNKKKYNISKAKAKQTLFNKVIARKLHTNNDNRPPLSFGGSGGPGGGNGPESILGLLFITALSCYISSNLNKKK